MVHSSFSSHMSDKSSDNKVPSEAIEAHIDTRSGAAALTRSEDWVRNNSSPEAHDGRAATRTYFDSRDAPGHYPSWQKDREPGDRRSWATLAGWQDGVQSDISRGGQNWWADKQRWVDTFADQLHATKYHKEETKRVLQELSASKPDGTEREMIAYSARRMPVEAVIVGILSLLIDADIDDFENRTLGRDGSHELLDDLEITVSEYEKVRSVLRQEHSDILFPNR